MTLVLNFTIEPHKCERLSSGPQWGDTIPVQAAPCASIQTSNASLPSVSSDLDIDLDSLDHPSFYQVLSELNNILKALDTLLKGLQ